MLKTDRGFTLVEVIVVVAVLGILLAIAIPDLRSWIQNTQTRNVAEGLLNGLDLARAEAIRRNSQVTLTLVGGSGWTISGPDTADADADNDLLETVTYQARPDGEGAGGAAVVWEAPTPPPATLSVTFNGLGRLARLGDTAVPAFALSDVAILARHDVGGDCRHDVPAGPMRCLRVVVRMGGSVRMCDPARPATDPQAC